MFLSDLVFVIPSSGSPFSQLIGKFLLFSIHSKSRFFVFEIIEKNAIDNLRQV